MRVPHFLSGWSKVGIDLIERLTEEEQSKLIENGDYVTRKTEHAYLMFKKIGMVTASGNRPLCMTYRRLKKARVKHSKR